MKNFVIIVSIYILHQKSENTKLIERNMHIFFHVFS